MKFSKKIKRLTSLMIILVMSLCAINVPMVAHADVDWPEAPEVNAPSFIAMDITTGTVLYEKNADEVHYPASITKILTGLIAVENCSLDEIITFSRLAVSQEGDTSHISRDIDEQMTMEQTLYGMMLASANECAWAIGEHVAGGDINVFTDMMNEKAAELGCTNTHFTNPNGLPDENHVTTARDMALIAAEAYRNETFRVIAGTKSYTIPTTNKHPDEETFLHNHHKMLYPYKGDSKYLYDYCVGGKTGYTIAANNTLVSYGLKDNMPIVTVVMSASTPDHYTDTRAIMDYVFDNYKIINISEYESEEKNVAGMTERKPFASIDKEACVLVPVGVEFSNLTRELVPGEDNDTLGTLVYSYNGRELGKASVTMAEIEAVDYDFSKKEPSEVSEVLDQIESGDDDVQEELEPIKIEINFRTIMIGLGALAVLGLIIFGIYWFFSHAYLIRQKQAIKKTRREERKRYHTIQNGAYSSRSARIPKMKKKKKLHF